MAGLPNSPTAALLCAKFALPAIPDLLKLLFLLLPKIPIPPIPILPILNISLGLNCAGANPLSVSAGLPWGGGRETNSLPDPDTTPESPE